MAVPVQYYQSVIAIELAVAGALLFQMRFFVPRGEAERKGEHIPYPRHRLLLAVIIGTTLFGALVSMFHSPDKPDAIAVTVGLALSLFPILLRVLPTLKRPDDPNQPGDRAIAVMGVVAYAIFTG